MVASMKFASVLSCILMMLATIYGGCLIDSDLSHTPADWNQRMWSYTSKRHVAPSTASDLSFMTFNLQSGFHFNCTNDVAAQAALMTSVDYVGTQETVQGVDTRCSRCAISQIIADATGMETRFAMAMPYRTGHYGINTGTTETIVDTKYVLMNYTGYEPRVAIAVKTLPSALQSKSLWFVTIHIEFYNSSVRLNQIKDILAFIESQILSQDPQATIVMAGDFNGGPWDPVYAFLQSKGFQNTWERFTGSILGGNTIPADFPGSRFDHIWYHVPSSVAVTVKNAQVLNVLYSDHRPYRATLSFSVSGTPSTSAPTSTPTVTKSPTPSPPPVQAVTKSPTPSPPPVQTVTKSPTPSPPPVQAVTKSPTSTPAPNGTVVCVGPVSETYSVTITCPSSAQKISTVQFASYGNPTGSCGNYMLGSCIGGSSVAVVTDKCLGRNTCTFPIANNVFGDPCPHAAKHFYAQVVCK